MSMSLTQRRRPSRSSTGEPIDGVPAQVASSWSPCASLAQSLDIYTLNGEVLGWGNHGGTFELATEGRLSDDWPVMSVRLMVFTRSIPIPRQPASQSCAIQ